MERAAVSLCATKENTGHQATGCVQWVPKVTTDLHPLLPSSPTKALPQKLTISLSHLPHPRLESRHPWPAEAQLSQSPFSSRRWVSDSNWPDTSQGAAVATQGHTSKRGHHPRQLCKNNKCILSCTAQLEILYQSSRTEMMHDSTLMWGPLLLDAEEMCLPCQELAAVMINSFEGQLAMQGAWLVQAGRRGGCFGAWPKISEETLWTNLRKPRSLTTFQRPLLWMSKVAFPSVFQE